MPISKIEKGTSRRMSVSASLVNPYGESLVSFNLPISPAELREITAMRDGEPAFQTALSFGKLLLFGLRCHWLSSNVGSPAPRASKPRAGRRAASAGSPGKKRRG